jgi:hypothetical protein
MGGGRIAGRQAPPAPRRDRARLALPLLLVALGLAGCVTPPSQLDNVCAVFDEKGGWFDDAVAVEQRWGVPIHTQMAIVRHESGFRHNALPPRRYLLGFLPWGRQSSAFGYAQAIEPTWQRYQRETGRFVADRDRFADSLDFIGWYLHTSRHEVGLSLDDTYSHYLAYHEGQGGFRRGSYKGKGWLLQRASQVTVTADRYRSQLAGCRAALEDRGLWWWPFG